MKTFALSLLLASCYGVLEQERRFPDDFIFGTATASYQIEGAWNADGKGESIWDHLTHTYPDVITDKSNGDEAADSYNNYARDVEIMRELGIDAYRFSLSWPRILPNGFSNETNNLGVQFYNNYINEMLKYNITPMITIYHWDLPQKLQDLGGFLNPMFPEWFEEYARTVFELFGDRVKHWITFNEPREICFEGYGSTTKAPMLNITDVGTYICAKQLVIAHARAYYAYDQDFRGKQGGICGITISVNWFGPLTDSDEDKFAAEIYRQAEWGLYAEPIFSQEGGFPKEFSKRVANNSYEQGYPWSRLPEFTPEEKEFVRGSADFFGVNHYTAFLISATEYKQSHPVPSLYADADGGAYRPPEWLSSASPWLKLAPNSLFNSLTYLSNRYNNPVFYITENGWSQSPGAGLEDDDRITYYRASLNSVLDCLEAGIKLKGFMAWSLFDNFEWMEGYTQCFGLYEVDFYLPEKTRTARKSAFIYKEIIRSRMIDPDYDPSTREMWIDEGH